MRVLAIESSCDESAAAIFDDARGLLAHELFSQVELHRLYRRRGAGARLARSRAPSAAAREEPLGFRRNRARASLSGVVYTAGPGLLGALLTGAALGRSLAYGWGIPALGVHHLEAHLLAPLLEDAPPPFPHVALLVSGGHTMLIDVRAHRQLRILGQTRDDAAGEAFDKTRKTAGTSISRRPRACAARRPRPRRRVLVPAPDARSRRPRVQFFGIEDCGAARGARTAAHGGGQGRYRLRSAGSHRRDAGCQGAARAR